MLRGEKLPDVLEPEFKDEEPEEEEPIRELPKKEHANDTAHEANARSFAPMHSARGR